MKVKFTLTPEDFKELVKELNDMVANDCYNGFQTLYGKTWINVHKDCDRSKDIEFTITENEKELEE